MENDYILEMHDVVKVFPGVRALDGVNLLVRPGKVHVICGENGAGKSTLMKIINGTYAADEGKMIYKGQEIGSHTIQDTMNMGIAMIYQELNPVLEMRLPKTYISDANREKERSSISRNSIRIRKNCWIG